MDPTKYHTALPRLHSMNLQALRDPPPVIQSTTASSSVSPLLKGSKHPGTSTYQPQSGTSLYECPDYKKRRKIVGEEIGEEWIETRDFPKSERLMDIFFTNEKESEDILESFKMSGKYGAVLRSPAKKPSGHRHKNPIEKGWVDLPSPPQKGEPGIDEGDIGAPLVLILNDIIQQLGLSGTRVAVDCHRSPVPTHDGGELKPDIFLWGKGSDAFPSIHGAPLPTISGKKRKNADSSCSDQIPSVDWRWCVVPIELKTEKSRGATTNRTAFLQLGTYAREAFAAQEHRRFVPSLLVTECTMEFLLWDRAGVVVSERLDYHTEALRFCHIIRTIVQWSDGHLGFDPTQSRNGDQVCLRTREEDQNEYIIEHTLFSSYTLRSRASTCWLARRRGDVTGRYIMYDSWVQGGMAAEYAILQKIEELRTQGHVTGVLPFVHMEEVEISAQPSCLDTTLHNRRKDCFTKDIVLVHTRTILRCDSHSCKPFSNFASPEEIVTGIHDVANGLRNLYERAGIVHRDIVPWNILIQPRAADGYRGVLIDFSCATFVNSRVIHPRFDVTPGSHVFRSRSSLCKAEKNIHLDDIEACYFILCFVASGHSGPNMAASRLEFEGDMCLWEVQKESAAWETKRGHFCKEFSLRLQTWFGETMSRLIIRLHKFFQARVEDGTPDIAQDFQTAIDCFIQAVVELRNPRDALLLAEVDADTKDPLDVKEGIVSSDSSDSDLHNPRSFKRVRLWDDGARIGGYTVEIVDHILLVDADCLVGTSTILPC